MAENKTILGNAKNLRHFEEAQKAGKLSHAYVINGAKGSGKKTLAEYVARGLLCEQPGIAPCGNCDRCIKTETDNHPDLIHVTHKKETVITVGEIREQVVDNISIKPYYGPYKIYIIEEAALMNVNAQNALLKTIEEPPAYGLLFLLTDNVDGLLETVRSRCLKMDMDHLAKEQIIEILVTQNGADRRTAEEAALFARGNLGLAIDLVEGRGIADLREFTADVMKTIARADAVKLTDQAQQIEASGPQQMLELFRTWFRDVLFVKSTGKQENLYFRKEHITIENQAQQLTYEQIDQVYRAIAETEAELAANVKAEAAAYTLLLKIRRNLL